MMARIRLLIFLYCIAAVLPAQPLPEHVWGRITAIHKNGFEVDENFNADPRSGYRRSNREITLNANTKFEMSARPDLQVGRTVDILGHKTTGSNVQATRIIVYEKNAPVRLPAQ